MGSIGRAENLRIGVCVRIFFSAVVYSRYMSIAIMSLLYYLASKWLSHEESIPGVCIPGTSRHSIAIVFILIQPI